MKAIMQIYCNDPLNAWTGVEGTWTHGSGLEKDMI